MSKKTVSTILALALISSSAMADSEFCGALAKAAENLMKGHQNGAAMSDMLAVNANKSPVLKDLLDSLVMEAYSEPRYGSEKMKLRIIGEFRDKIHVECLRQIND